MKTKISIFITSIALLFVATATFAQGTQAYFKKNGATVFQSSISNIDSIVFMPYVDEINYFPDAAVVEAEYMGDTVYCKYVEGYYIMQGDIVIKSDYDSIDENNTNLRAAEQRGINRWINGKVYYKIMSNNSIVKNDINTAISNYRAYTNLKFIPVQTDEAKTYITDYLKSGRIEFVDANENKSYVGMINSTAQNLWLDVNSPSALHEIGHAIGLMHEHSRSDRDKYINVNYNNIKPEDRHDFDINPTGMGVYYPTDALDFRSIMMYPPKIQNAINPNIAVITKKDGSAFTEYQRKVLTFSDSYVINQIYPKLVLVTSDVFIHDKNIQPTGNSCELTGEIIYEGEPAVTGYGIQYRESGATSYNNEPGTNKDAVGRYTSQLTNLKPNTTYEASAYVIQNGLAFFSYNKASFTTKSIPVISISNITSTSATATVSIVPKDYIDNGTPVSVSYCISTDKNFSKGTWSNGTEIAFNISQDTYTFNNLTFNNQPLKPETTYYIYGWVRFVKNGVNGYVEGDRTLNNFTTLKKYDTCEDFDDPQGFVVINGVRWATRNVGASSPCDYGGYYQWNKSTTDFLLWDDYLNSIYVYSDDGSWMSANDPSPAGYRLPTSAEMQSLFNTTYVSYERITLNGINGDKYTDRATSNSIFLPAAGYRYSRDGALYDVGSIGYYWENWVLDYPGPWQYLIGSDGCSVRPVAK